MKKAIRSTIKILSALGILSSLLLQAVPAFAKAPLEDLDPFVQNEYINAEIVRVNEDGSISYGTDPLSGISFLDYSRVGYHSGEKEIPTVPVVKTLEPGDLKDHTQLIQSAIYEVAALPEDQRGAILLKAGVYVISDHILIRASGIVLRGEGEGVNGTLIYDTSTFSRYASVYIQGSGSYTIHHETTSAVIDEKIPVGNPTLHLSEEDVKKFSVGDRVLLTVAPNDQWIQTLGMDNLDPPWKKEDYVMRYERVILAIDGNKITLDNSAAMSIDKTLGDATLSKIADAGRVTESAVENIRFQSYYDVSAVVDENHTWRAVCTQNAKDCWVRNVTAVNYAYACVEVGSWSTNITVDRCSMLEPVSVIGGERRYCFFIGKDAACSIVQNCFSGSGRHDFAIGNRSLGPNVFYNCVTSDSYDSSEPHNNWGTGALYDNVYCVGSSRKGTLQVKNNGNSGTHHGWMGANTVFWNCLAERIIVAKPQTEQNFAIGSYGIYEKLSSGKDLYLGKFVWPDVSPENYPTGKAEEGSPICGNGYIESFFNPVNPSSLYQAQLAYRLRGDATKDITPISPILNYPRYDHTNMDSEIKVVGFCDINADRVYVYVDGERAYEFDSTDKTSFSISVPVSAGYHSVSVSQRIAGYESAKTPDRFVFVNTDENVKPVPNIIKYLASIGHEPAIKEIEYRESTMAFYRDSVATMKADADNSYAAILESLTSLENSLANGDKALAKDCLAKMKKQTTALKSTASKIEQYFKMAETYNCYEEYMIPIMECLEDSFTLRSNATILFARAEREITNGRVEDYDYSVELENGGPIETTPPETETVTEPETKPETELETSPESNGGCKSALSFVLPAILLMSALPLALKKKKR